MPRLLADTTPLKTPAFRRLWLAGVVSSLGAQFTVVAVPFQLYQLTHSSAYVGLSGLFSLLPMLVLAPLGGVLADMFDRRRILVITSTGLALSSVLLWAQAALPSGHGGQVWLILGLFALQQAFFSVNNPARGAIIPLLLPKEQLPAANALNFTAVGLTTFIGPMLGGVLLSLVGKVHWVSLSSLYLIDALTMCATISAAVRLPALRRPAEPDAERPTVRSAFSSLAEGFAHLRSDQILLATFLVDLIAMVFGNPRALFPETAHTVYGDPIGGPQPHLGPLYAAIPIGAFLGGLLSGWAPRVRRQGFAIILAITVWGVAMMGFGGALELRASFGFWIAIFMLAVGGYADAISSMFRSTMLQTAAPDELRGRMQGVFFLVVAGGPRLADLLHGYGAGLLGVAPTAILGGLLSVVGVIISAIALPRFTGYRTSPVVESDA